MKEIVCKHQHPLIQSHHDMVVSTFSLPFYKEMVKRVDNITAPEVDNERVKIVWSDEGVRDYENALADNLTRLRNTWCEPSSPALMSVLLSTTYSMMLTAASTTNKSVQLGKRSQQRPSIPPDIRAAQQNLMKKHKLLKQVKSSQNSDLSALEAARLAHSDARAAYRQAVRGEQRDRAIKRDLLLSSVCSSNPRSVFKTIKSIKSVSSTKISELHVKDKIYKGDEVPSGFFDSLSALKSPDMSDIHSSAEFKSTLSDYSNIIKICKSSSKIPSISYRQATDILLSLRPEVNDFYSITPYHFIHAGKAGFEHFFFLMSALIQNINLASLEELNTVWACILHKGHGKSKTSERSYRTISTCPLLAKALDTYVGQLYGLGPSSSSHTISG